MRRYFVRFILLISDLLFVLLSIYLSFFVKNIFFSKNQDYVSFDTYLTISCYTLLSWFIFMLFERMYSLEKLKLSEIFYKILKVNLSAFFLLVTFIYAFKSSHVYSRIFIFLIPIIGTILLMFSRYLTGKIFSKFSFFKIQSVLIALEKDLEYFFKNLKLDLEKEDYFEKTYIFKKSSELLENIKKIDFQSEQIIVITRSISLRNFFKLMTELKGKAYKIKIIPNLKNFELAEFNLIL